MFWLLVTPWTIWLGSEGWTKYILIIWFLWWHPRRANRQACADGERGPPIGMSGNLNILEFWPLRARILVDRFARKICLRILVNLHTQTHSSLFNINNLYSLVTIPIWSLKNLDLLYCLLSVRVVGWGGVFRARSWGIPFRQNLLLILFDFS